MTQRRHKHPLIYWAGPIGTLDVREANCLAGIDDADQFWRETGAHPILPHLCHWWDLRSAHPYEEWIARGHDVLTSCDALYRMPGVSPGTDREVAVAESINLPVFTDREALRAFVNTWHEDWARRDALVAKLHQTPPKTFAEVDGTKTSPDLGSSLLSNTAMIIGAAGYVLGKRGGEDRLLARLSEILACMPNDDEIFHAVKFLLERNQRIDEYLINYAEYGGTGDMKEMLRRFDERGET